MRRTIIAVALALLVTACGGSDDDVAVGGPTTLAKSLPTNAPSSIAVAAEPPVTGPPVTEAPGDAAAAPVDGCDLVTRGEAEALFGGTAVQSEDDVGLIPVALATCVWEWDGDDGLSFQLLVVQVAKGPQFYGEEIYPEAERLDLGDRGFISIEPVFNAVTIQFISGGNTVIISLSAFGAKSPDVTTLGDEMRALARIVHDRLP